MKKEDLSEYQNQLKEKLYLRLLEMNLQDPQRAKAWLQTLVEFTSTVLKEQ